jgi:hypothetical protein
MSQVTFSSVWISIFAFRERSPFLTLELIDLMLENGVDYLVSTLGKVGGGWLPTLAQENLSEIFRTT